VIVDPRLLESFVVLADELHFTRAAMRLHVAQPALSQQIARLERQLGGALFERSSQGVALTEAGAALLARCAPALDQIEAGIEEARDIASGRRGALRVGFLSSLATPAVPLIAAALRERAPAVTLTLSEATMSRQLSELRARRLDVGLFSVFEGVDFDSDDLVVDRLVEGPQYVAMPGAHSRAGAREIALEDLADESFVMPSGSDEHGYRAAVLAVAQRHGFAARPGPQADNVATMLGLVASGFGVTLVAWPTALVPRAQVVFVPVAGESVELVAVRPTPGGAGDAFVAAAREVLTDLVPRA
jgi:DNA-binding transcriptional LysR family regulator